MVPRESRSLRSYLLLWKKEGEMRCFLRIVRRRKTLPRITQATVSIARGWTGWSSLVKRTGKESRDCYATLAVLIHSSRCPEMFYTRLISGLRDEGWTGMG